MNPPTQRYVRQTLVACAAGIVLMFVDVMAQTPPATPAPGAMQRAPRQSNGRSRLQRRLGAHPRVGHASRAGFARFDPKTGALTLPSRTSNPVDFERDAGCALRVFPRERRPWYSPRHWERVQFNDVHGHSVLAPDPEFQCMPEGVPRIGMPEEIVQTGQAHDLHVSTA